MNFSFHPGAKQDVAQAVDFYQAQAAPAVAMRFVQELGRVIALLLEHPGFGTPTTGKRRIFPLKQFPYSVVYTAQNDQLKILVVRHQKRNPQFGRGRQ